MKIIKQGDAAWPLTITNCCRSCGTTYRLERPEEFARHGDGPSNDCIVSACPVCKHTVVTRNPNILTAWSPIHGVAIGHQP